MGDLPWVYRPDQAKCSADVFADKDVVLALMRHNPYAWTSASPELLQDPEVLNCSMLLHRDSSGDWDGSWLRFGPPHHWSKVPRHFFANKQIVMGLIPTDGIE